MKAWIPGAKGLVGSFLSTQIPSIGTGREVDIADLDQVEAFLEQNGSITHIFNCAAFSLVDPAEIKREEAFNANALGPEVLGRAAKKGQIPLLHLSTDYVFPGNGHRPLHETDQAAPCNYYGLTKLEGERRLQAVYPDACILRTSWLYGWGGKNFVARVLDLLQKPEPLRLVADQISRPTYAPDLVQVMLQMANRSGLYQFANAGPTSKYDFALALREEAVKLGLPIYCPKIEPCLSSEFPSPAKRPLYTAFDTATIEHLLHIKPRHWRDTLPEYLRQRAQ